MSRVRLTGCLPPWIPATRPTRTPRILTLAPVSMTRPARSAVQVTDTTGLRVPENDAMLKTIRPTMMTPSTTAHHAGWIRPYPVLSSMALAGHVEVAGLPVNGKRRKENDEGGRHQRRAHRPANGLA